FKLVTRYAQLLKEKGMVFKDLYFRDKDKPFFSKEKIKEIYYSFPHNYKLSNRIDATRESLVNSLNHMIASESKKAWVADTIENLSQEQLNQLYDRPDQEFESIEKEERFLARKIVIKELQKVNKKINHNQFLNIRRQYINFLRLVGRSVDFTKYGFTDEEWDNH
ncbi:ATP-dependent DNA helicase, partial [Veillonellaceae bacterium M2-4]|nr:ATP-dependent DNA helicase [Veillonellaceae bacterium M2-4]